MNNQALNCLDGAEPRGASSCSEASAQRTRFSAGGAFTAAMGSTSKGGGAFDLLGDAEQILKRWTAAARSLNKVSQILHKFGCHFTHLLVLQTNLTK